MAQIKKTRFPIGLNKIPVLIDDVSIDSDYFRLKDFPNILHAGKNYFLIGGSDLLKPDSQVLVEITDSQGGSIYYEIPDALIAGTFRIVSIFVYSDTPIGEATVTIIGEAQQFKQNSLSVDAQLLESLQKQLDTWKNTKPIQSTNIDSSVINQQLKIQQAQVAALQSAVNTLNTKVSQDETLLNIPIIWKGKPNVRWTGKVKIDTLKGDDVPAVMQKSPKLLVTEVYDDSRSLDIILTPQTFSADYASGALGTAFGNKKNNSDYFVKLTTGSFVKSMEGAIIVFPAPCSSLAIPRPFNTQITRVVNSTLAQVSPSYIFIKADTDIFGRPLQSIFQPIEFTQPSAFTLQYASQSQNTGSINKRISYLNVKVTDLDTYAGVLKYVDIFKQPGNVFVGRYPIQPNEKICRGSYFFTVNDFINNWNIATQFVPCANSWSVEMTNDWNSGSAPYTPTNLDWSASVALFGVLYSGSMQDIGQTIPSPNSLTLFYGPPGGFDFFGIGGINYGGKLTKFTTYVLVKTPFIFQGTASVDDAISFYIDGTQVAALSMAGNMPFNIAFNTGSHIVDLYLQNIPPGGSGNNYFVAFGQSLSTNSNIYFMDSCSVLDIRHDSTKLLDAINMIQIVASLSGSIFEAIIEDEIITP